MLPVASHDDRQLLCHAIVVVSYVLLMEMLVMNSVISVENEAYSAQKKLCALKFSMFESWELKKCIGGCIRQDWIEKISIECQAKDFSFLGQNSNYFNLAQIRGEQIRFGSVFTRKKQPNRKKKKETRNRTGTGPNRPVPVRFRSGFLSKKTGQTYRLILGLFWAF